jgi:hypothetical protein
MVGQASVPALEKVFLSEKRGAYNFISEDFLTGGWMGLSIS